MLNKITAAMLLFAALCPAGCAGADRKAAARPVGPAGLRIAVLPVDNLSGGPAPLKDIRQGIEKMLKGRGLDITDDDALERFMAKHRIRYTGGVDAEGSRLFKDELGVDGVLVTSLELYSGVTPPKVAMTIRLVRAGGDPEILWVDGVGLAGDDSPGIFGLGLMEDPKALLDTALKGLTGSLAGYLSDGAVPKGCAGGRRYRPRVAYRSPGLVPGRRYSVAVMPFLNGSERRNAGEILALQFIRRMWASGMFKVVEPGVVRGELLKYRVILEGGVSLDNAELVMGTLDADLVLTGDVLDCEDYQGLYGVPKVGFTAMLIDRKARETVWTSRSYNEGDDYVYLFDFGRMNTTDKMACRMVGNVVDMMVAP